MQSCSFDEKEEFEEVTLILSLEASQTVRFYNSSGHQIPKSSLSSMADTPYSIPTAISSFTTISLHSISTTNVTHRQQLMPFLSPALTSDL